MLERDFQKRLRQDLKRIFPGCVVIKTDPTNFQGCPDLFIFYENKWAALECKKSEKSHHQPNQDHWIGVLDEMSFADFVYPENRKDILDELQEFFSS